LIWYCYTGVLACRWTPIEGRESQS
jgi:hypothetical protein